MNKNFKKSTKSYRIVEIILNHIEKNIKEYIIISLIFLIGIIIGIICINKSTDGQKEEITSYISSFINNLKEENSVNEMTLLFNSIKKNLIFAILLWFMGSTVIGILVVYLTICFRGFCLGYTASSIILTLGGRKRNCIFIFIIVFTKYIIHTSNFCACC